MKRRSCDMYTMEYICNFEKKKKKKKLKCMIWVVIRVGSTGVTLFWTHGACIHYSFFFFFFFFFLQ